MNRPARVVVAVGQEVQARCPVLVVAELAPEAHRVIGVSSLGGEGAVPAEGVISRGGAHLGKGGLTGQVQRDGLGEAALGVKSVGGAGAAGLAVVVLEAQLGSRGPGEGEAKRGHKNLWFLRARCRNQQVRLHQSCLHCPAQADRSHQPSRSR